MNEWPLISPNGRENNKPFPIEILSTIVSDWLKTLHFPTLSSWHSEWPSQWLMCLICWRPRLLRHPRIHISSPTPPDVSMDTSIGRTVRSLMDLALFVAPFRTSILDSRFGRWSMWRTRLDSIRHWATSPNTRRRWERRPRTILTCTTGSPRGTAIRRRCLRPRYHVNRRQLPMPRIVTCPCMSRSQRITQGLGRNTRQPVWHLKPPLFATTTPTSTMHPRRVISSITFNINSSIIRRHGIWTYFYIGEGKNKMEEFAIGESYFVLIKLKHLIL